MEEEGNRRLSLVRRIAGRCQTREAFVKYYAFDTFRFPSVGDNEVVLGDAAGRSFSLRICISVTHFTGATAFNVSLRGFLLIAKAVKGSDHPPLPIHQAHLLTIRETSIRSIRELAAYAALQPLWPVDLMLNEVQCSTPTDGQALVGLLQQCGNWHVRRLKLDGTVDGHFWEGLASAMKIGPLQHPPDAITYIRLSRRVLARGRPDDLRRVWRFTGGNWWVYGNAEGIKRGELLGVGWVDREEDGWKKILLELDKEVTSEMDPVSQT